MIKLLAKAKEIRQQRFGRYEMKTAVMIGDSHSQLVFPFSKDQLPFQYLDIISKPGWGVKKYMNEGIPQSLPRC